MIQYSESGSFCSSFLFHYTFLEVRDHTRQAMFQWDFGLPIQKRFGLRDVRFSHMWIICSVGFELDRCTRVDCFFYHLQRNSVVLWFLLGALGTRIRGIFKEEWVVNSSVRADLRKLQHCKFSRISQVKRSNMVTFHQNYQPINL